MKTRKPEKKYLKKMRKEFDDFDGEQRKARSKKPLREGRTRLIGNEADEDENFDED